MTNLSIRNPENFIPFNAGFRYSCFDLIAINPVTYRKITVNEDNIQRLVRILL